MIKYVLRSWCCLLPSSEGPMSSPNVFATGYYSSRLNDDPHHPDIQHTLTYIGFTQFFAQIFGPFTGVHRDLLQRYLRGFIGRDGNMVATTLVRPRSTGYVTLNKTNIYGKPIIEPNYFADDRDLEALVDGMQNLIDFYEKTPAYAAAGAKFFPKPFPPCRRHHFRSHNYYRCHVQHLTMTLWHFSGTCKMGKIGDPDAVTDSRLR